MDGRQISDIEFRVLVGIHNQSSAVPEPRKSDYLPILTEHKMSKWKSKVHPVDTRQM